MRGAIAELFRPHSHDAADSVDSALEASERGLRAVKISFVALMVTALLQVLVIAATGSVALLADTIHNFSDALTAVPLFVAFRLSRRPPTRRYTYGYRRAEDLAGVFVIAMIALSAVIAAYQAIDRLINPRPITNIGWLFLAGLIGFAGNELVALYRIRVGRQIGSAALEADGYHARTDGFTSLAVSIGAIGVWLGFERADPIVGLVISIAIFAVLRTRRPPGVPPTHGRRRPGDRRVDRALRRACGRRAAGGCGASPLGRPPPGRVDRRGGR